jgi:hypothetical protein
VFDAHRLCFSFDLVPRGHFQIHPARLDQGAIACLALLHQRGQDINSADEAIGNDGRHAPQQITAAKADFEYAIIHTQSELRERHIIQRAIAPISQRTQQPPADEAGWVAQLACHELSEHDFQPDLIKLSKVPDRGLVVEVHDEAALLADQQNELMTGHAPY